MGVFRSRWFVAIIFGLISLGQAYPYARACDDMVKQAEEECDCCQKSDGQCPHCKKKGGCPLDKSKKHSKKQHSKHQTRHTKHQHQEIAHHQELSHSHSHPPGQKLRDVEKADSNSSDHEHPCPHHQAKEDEENNMSQEEKPQARWLAPDCGSKSKRDFYGFQTDPFLLTRFRPFRVSFPNQTIRLSVAYLQTWVPSQDGPPPRV